MEEIKAQDETREKTGGGVSGFRYNYETPYYYSYTPGHGVKHRALARSARDIAMAAEVAEANITMAGCGPKDYLHRLVELHRRVEGTIRLMAEAFDVQGLVDGAADEIRTSEAGDPKELVDPEKEGKRQPISDAIALGVLAEIFGDRS